MKWLAALCLCACSAPGGGPTAQATASEAASTTASATPSASASVAPAPLGLQRRASPAEVRQRDEQACGGGDVGACRRMADRFRGYGAPAGCGVDRGRAAPFVKRSSEDSPGDDRAFLGWIAKVCDSGDASACAIERYARMYAPNATGVLDMQRLRSDPAGSAVFAWQKATGAPGMYETIMEARAKCFGEEGVSGCAASAPLYRLTGFQPDKPEKVLAIATKICEGTLECADVDWMLDRNRVSLDARAPFRAKAAQTLIDACLDGSCVCSEAASFLEASDPRAGDLAQLGCENGEAEGCYQLGRMCELGLGVPKDEARAFALYRLACPPTHPDDPKTSPRIGEFSAHACDRLAEYHERGEMPPKDEETAAYYAHFACWRASNPREHAPCVRLARYYATTKKRTGSRHDNALFYFNGGDNGKECERPSVKQLCDTHFKEIMGSKN